MDKKDTAVQIRMMSSPQERQAATVLRQKYFFNRVPIKDPYLWTFDHKDHLHFVLYEGSDIVGYAHIYPHGFSKKLMILLAEISF